MEGFTIRIADFSIKINTDNDEVREACRNYIVENVPCDIEIDVSDGDVERERVIARKEDGKEIPYTRGRLEATAIYRKIAAMLFPHGRLVLHGAVVALDKEAYVFCARSGVGKTTHIRYWKEFFGERLTIVNGDKPIVYEKDGRVFACGTPWSGKEQLETNCAAPIKAVCMLSRGEENSIREITSSEALPELSRQFYVPEAAGAGIALLELFRQMDKTVKFYRLQCNKSLDAAKVAYEGMK